MTIALIILILLVLALAFALFHQVKKTNDQAAENQQLLNDYQKRVDEQEKLLSDYRSLEQNFDGVGEGYEQALLAFDKIEEEKQKIVERNNYLEQRCHDLEESSSAAMKVAHEKYGMVQQLTRAALDEAAKLSDAKPVITLLNKLQDVSEVGSQSALEHSETVPARQIAEQAVSESGIREVSYLTFDMFVDDDAAQTSLRTNGQKAARVVALLLDNAKKFTTEGKVTLYVNAEGDKIQYVVEDTGMGVAAEDGERIFEEFVQLNSYFDGMGIGLTAARSIARRLDGEVVLDTTYAGPGARFIFSLPM